jgi:hypothetical protein
MRSAGRTGTSCSGSSSSCTPIGVAEGGRHRPWPGHLQGDNRAASRQDILSGRRRGGERVHIHGAGLRGVLMNKDKILIVDDEADIALILKLQLEDVGYKTVTGPRRHRGPRTHRQGEIRPDSSRYQNAAHGWHAGPGRGSGNSIRIPG